MADFDIELKRQRELQQSKKKPVNPQRSTVDIPGSDIKLSATGKEKTSARTQKDESDLIEDQDAWTHQLNKQRTKHDTDLEKQKISKLSHTPLHIPPIRNIDSFEPSEETNYLLNADSPEQENEWGKQLRSDHLKDFRRYGKDEKLKKELLDQIGPFNKIKLSQDEQKIAKILETEQGTRERKQAVRAAIESTKIYKSAFLTKSGTFGFMIALFVAAGKDFADVVLVWLDAGTITSFITVIFFYATLFFIIHRSIIQKILYQFRGITRVKIAIRNAILKRFWKFLVAPLVESLPFLSVFPTTVVFVYFFKRSIDKAVAEAEYDFKKMEDSIKALDH